MPETIDVQPSTVAQPQPVSPVHLPHPLGQLASLSGLGNVGILIAAVGLMWARIDSIETRFDTVDMQLDEMTREVADLSAAMQVMAVKSVVPSDFTELERRVTIIESQL